MTNSDSGEPPIDDPDWIKGLVAKALLQAAEDDDADPAPVEPPSTRPPAPEPVLDGAVPAQPAPSDALAAPLIVGRGLADGATPSEPAADLADRVGSTIDPPPGGSPPRVTAVVDDIAPEPPLLEAEPVMVARDDAPADEPARDHVMVEEDATVEGFRSSDIRTVLEWLAVIVSALVVALVIKAFVLQAFWIPSESMESTVNKGDRILVNKLSYRLHDIRRGDLVVFKKLPGTPGDTEDLIKRAIALPGETIEVRDDGRIWIWGPGETPEDALQLQEPYLDPRNERLPVPSPTDSLSTDVWDDSCANQPRTPGRCTLGPDQYFMMGDNRASSSDSRFFGPVPEDLVVGRAFLRIWPLGELSSL